MDKSPTPSDRRAQRRC
uniref:Uncharacterized protein n=1 Tax=Arundo donax TaxID=35708 RepID=A0A0A9B973_ARUDO